MAALPLIGAAVVQTLHRSESAGFDRAEPPCRVGVASRVVALSIDDGPSPAHTPSMLRLLERHGVRATFFLLGSQAERHPDLVRAELAAGMEIGNHSWSHPHLRTMARADEHREITRTQELLAAIAGPAHAPALFRPPFGDIGARGLAVVRARNLAVVLWTLVLEDYLDWGMNLPPAQAAERALRDIRPGDVIMAHDGGGGPRAASVQTLDLLLAGLRAGGYTVVTVRTLLGSGRAVAATSMPWFWQFGFDCPAAASPVTAPGGGGGARGQ